MNTLLRFLWITISFSLLVSYSFCLNLFNHDNESSDTLRDRLHSHSLMYNPSQPLVNPKTKTAVKTAACASIGKGICLGVSTAKYADKKVFESNNTSYNK